MGTNGQPGTTTDNGTALRWSRTVLAYDDLRRSLNGHRRVLVPPRTVVTPLAKEHLRSAGIELSEDKPAVSPANAPRWGYAQERPHPMVQSAVQALEREGTLLRPLMSPASATTSPWVRDLAECVAGGECQGGVVFCWDPEMACCVANKVPGLRAAVVCSVPQTGRALLTLAANLILVEMPGRTWFEIRQILRTVCSSTRPVCPPGVACTLEELDRHAHR